uniref:Uncharacterized protein n=1 Tax=Phytophthora ramorum TaxID=164328 RepID=H3GXV4_PHYRM
MATASTTVAATAHVPHRTAVLRPIGTKVQATQQEKDLWASHTTEQFELLEQTVIRRFRSYTCTHARATLAHMYPLQVFKETEPGGLWQRLYHRQDFCYGALKDGVKEV